MEDLHWYFFRLSMIFRYFLKVLHHGFISIQYHFAILVYQCFYTFSASYICGEKSDDLQVAQNLLGSLRSLKSNLNQILFGTIKGSTVKSGLEF